MRALEVALHTSMLDTWMHFKSVCRHTHMFAGKHMYGMVNIFGCCHTCVCVSSHAYAHTHTRVWKYGLGLRVLSTTCTKAPCSSQEPEVSWISCSKSQATSTPKWALPSERLRTACTAPACSTNRTRHLSTSSRVITLAEKDAAGQDTEVDGLDKALKAVTPEDVDHENSAIIHPHCEIPCVVLSRYLPEEFVRAQQ